MVIHTVMTSMNNSKSEAHKELSFVLFSPLVLFNYYLSGVYYDFDGRYFYVVKKNWELHSFAYYALFGNQYLGVDDDTYMLHIYLFDI